MPQTSGVPAVDLLPENWTADGWKILIYRPGPAEIGDEEVTVQRAADRVRVAASREATAIAEVCRKTGISEASFYSWRKKVWRVDAVGDAAAEAARRSECAVGKVGRRLT